MWKEDTTASVRTRLVFHCSHKQVHHSGEALTQKALKYWTDLQRGCAGGESAADG